MTEGADPSLDFMLGRIKQIADEWIEVSATLAKEGINALSGQTSDRETWAKDVWSTWATLGGRAVEASYLSAVIADRLRSQAGPATTKARLATNVSDG